MLNPIWMLISLALTQPSIGWGYDCIGPKTASNFAVYLHGMDTQKPSTQELLNRQKLLDIANVLNIRIALPRATDPCPNDKNLICWGWNFNDSKVIDLALSVSAKAEAECFSNGKPVGLIGFSNGGFVANQIVEDCKKSEFSWFISIGAAGSWSDSKIIDLSKCGRISILAGKQDKYNYENIKNLASRFKKSKTQVSLIEYEGGHEVPMKKFEQELNRYLKK